MKSEDELRRATVPAEAKPDFRAEKAGVLALITPLTNEAREWLRSAVTEESSWSGETLAVEMRYFPDLVDAIIDDGFLFER